MSRVDHDVLADCLVTAMKRHLVKEFMWDAARKWVKVYGVDSPNARENKETIRIIMFETITAYYQKTKQVATPALQRELENMIISDMLPGALALEPLKKEWLDEINEKFRSEEKPLTADAKLKRDFVYGLRFAKERFEMLEQEIETFSPELNAAISAEFEKLRSSLTSIQSVKVATPEMLTQVYKIKEDIIAFIETQRNRLLAEINMAADIVVPVRSQLYRTVELSGFDTQLNLLDNARRREVPEGNPLEQLFRFYTKHVQEINILVESANKLKANAGQIQQCGQLRREIIALLGNSGTLFKRLSLNKIYAGPELQALRERIEALQREKERIESLPQRAASAATYNDKIALLTSIRRLLAAMHLDLCALQKDINKAVKLSDLHTVQQCNHVEKLFSLAASNIRILNEKLKDFSSKKAIEYQPVVVEINALKAELNKVHCSYSLILAHRFESNAAAFTTAISDTTSRIGEILEGLEALNTRVDSVQWDSVDLTPEDKMKRKVEKVISDYLNLTTLKHGGPSGLMVSVRQTPSF